VEKDLNVVVCMILSVGIWKDNNMGAWSETIMGNDSVLDEVYEVEDICGGTVTKKSMEANMDKFIKAVKENEDNHYFLHAVGAKILETGSMLPDIIKESVVIACKDEIEEGCGSWSEPEKRKFFLNDFINLLEEYDGTPTELESESLFDKIALSMM
jgi:hypothetical protein